MSIARRSSRFIPNPTPCGRSRREFLWQVGGGFAGLALVDLLSRTGFFSASLRAGELRPESQREAAAGTQPSLMSPQDPHFPARAKRVVFLFMNGAPSQIDTFDHKPALARYHDSPYQGPTPVGSNGRPVGRLMKSPFAFR